VRETTCIRYFPHKGERMRIVHNIQEDDTIEDMGRSMPRIYAALDNSKEDTNLI
jgi:hypothetical protein